jgi:pilus assembly protein Flp/PilA
MLDEEGQGMVEYGLILALIAIVVIGVLSTMGTNLGDLFQEIANKVAERPTS